MAFENIQWGMIPAAGQRDQNLLLQAIGQGVASYERGQERELQRRKLEQQAQKPMDFKNVAMTAQYKKNLGMPTTQEEEAAIQLMAQTTAPKTYIDPITQQAVTQPSPWQSLLGGQAPMQDSLITAPVPPVQASPIARPDMISATGESRGDLYRTQGDVASVQPKFKSDILTKEEFDTYKAGGALAGTPRGQMMEEEFKQDIAKEEAKDVIAANRKRREDALEKQKGMPRAERRLVDFSSKLETTGKNIDKAISQVSPWSAGYGSWLSVLPQTDATDLNATLATIGADAAFGTLQEMRENSKTGGALGSVSERELDLLKNSIVPLGQDQSPEQLIENLNEYKQIRNDSLKRVINAYEQDYGYIPESLMSLVTEEEPQVTTSGWGIRKLD